MDGYFKSFNIVTNLLITICHFEQSEKSYILSTKERFLVTSLLEMTFFR